MLAKVIHSCLCTALVFSAGALACPDYDDLPFYKALNGSDVDADGLVKRYYTVETGDGTGAYPSTWPDSTLPYCFEDDNARTQLAKIVESGWKVWQSAGVNHRIHMGEYNNCPPAGAGGLVPPGNAYLLIKVNAMGKMLTTVGKQSYVAGNGATMRFDPSPAIGMRDPVANMAHEIGHAWGFYHEQQRPSFWSRAEYPEGVGAINQINFDCTQLSDYATHAGQRSNDNTKDPCHNQLTAKGRGFSALEFLPMPEQFSSQPESGDFDWKSIMLYASAIGGTVVNGVPQNVYTKASDGSVVTYNKTPSQKDVNKFNALYSAKAPYPNPCLINQGCSPSKAMFGNIKAACKNIGKG